MSRGRVDPRLLTDRQVIVVGKLLRCAELWCDERGIPRTADEQDVLIAFDREVRAHDVLIAFDREVRAHRAG